MDYRTNATTLNALLTALEERPDNLVFENGGKGYNYAKMLTAITVGTTAGKTVVDAFVTAKADPVNADVLPGIVVTVSSVTVANITTTAGTAPVLPSTVTVTMSDGTTKSVNVTWTTVDPSKYAAVGLYTVSGTIAESATEKATATVVVEPVALKITAIGVYNAIFGSTKVTVNDSSLVKAAFDGTTNLGVPLVNDATHVTVFSDVAITALALAGADGVKVAK
jgi:hypothetical protein